MQTYDSNPQKKNRKTSATKPAGKPKPAPVTQLAPLAESSRTSGAKAYVQQRKQLTRGQSRHRATNRSKRFSIGHAGLAASLLTLTQGAARACPKVPANPLLIGIGIGLAVLSVIYLIWTELR